MSYKTKEEIIEYFKNFYITTSEIPKSTDTNHPFTKSRVRTLFGGWNNALTESNIPLRINPKQLVICKNCNKKFEKLHNQIKKYINNFCSQSCSTSFNNTNRFLSEETKQKISEKLKGKINGNELVIPKLCVICGIEHFLKRKTCSDECYNILCPDIKKDTKIYDSVNIESKVMLNLN